MRTDDETPASAAPDQDGADKAPPARRARAARKAPVKDGTAGATGTRPRAARKAQAGPSDAGDAEATGTGTGAGAGAGGAYKTRDLVDRVAKVAGMKRRSVKPLVETVLGELSAALHAGRPLSLRPLGKVTVSRTREAGGGHVLVCRIRQRGTAAATPAPGGETADPALAEGGEGR
jgi:DNA-binding protein HU-alpha